jgi:hypothetical protein
MVATALLSVGMLALVGMQITTISATRFSGKMTQALMLAEQEASRLMALDWDHADLGGPSKLTMTDPAYGANFVDPDNYVNDPSAIADRCRGLAFSDTGVMDDTVPVADAPFQRCLQLDPQDLNPTIPGADALRIRVFVRFRDIDTAASWRMSSITVVKAKVF